MLFYATVLCILGISLADNFSTSLTENFSLFPQLPVAFPWSENEQCRQDSELLLSNLRNQTLWAVRMVDASSRSPFGILDGNMLQFGNLDECIRVQTPMKTHMCVIKVTADLSPMTLPESDPYQLDPPPMENVWVKIRDSLIDSSKYPRNSVGMSLCLPRSCGKSETVQALNVFLNRTNNERRTQNLSTFSADIPFECKTDEQPPFTVSEVAFWLVSAMIVSLTTISTTMDNPSEKKSTKCQKLLYAFSLRKTLKSFIKHEGERGPLDFLYGVKFVTIMLIITDHRMAIFIGSAVFNYHGVEQELRGYNNLFLPHGDLLVDTFFYIAGLLSAYLTLQVFSKKFVNPLLLIFSRFIRIMPLYLFLIWFYASAMLRLGSGLGWTVYLGEDALFCQKYWWTNVLFINNYVHPDKMCMLHAWFLACDFHFFVSCIFFVILLCKKPRLGQIVLYTLLLVFTVIPAVIVYVNNIKPNILYYSGFLVKPREDPTFLHIYIKSHTRAAVYIMGILFGYFLFKRQHAPKKFGPGVSVLISLVGLATLFSPMAYGSMYYHPGRPYNVIESSIFATLRRIIWGIGCTILMFAHRFGHIPIIGPLCSSRAMIVLSKLTYGSYLVHFVMQVADYSKTKVSNQYVAYELVNRALTDIVVSLMYSLVLYLMIEQPSRTIFKVLIFSRERVASKVKTELPSITSPTITKLDEQSKNGTVYTIKL